jgi:hypothetical protein
LIRAAPGPHRWIRGLIKAKVIDSPGLHWTARSGGVGFEDHDYGIAARGGMVGGKDHGQPVRGNLNSATNSRLGQQFRIGAAVER